MNVRRQLVFWCITLLILTALFSKSLGGLIYSFYFVTFLLPVVFCTSFFFNYFLVPRYLLKERKGKFILYSIYMIIVSIYLELLVMVLSFVILADYQVENLGKIASDIYLLTTILYLIVFVHGFMEVFRKLKLKEQKIVEMEEEKESEKLQFLLLKVNRSNVRVALNDILYIESLSDYVKVHTIGEIFVSKERISQLEGVLPVRFVRIHRSFLINSEHVAHFNKEELIINEIKLPIGRTYKKEAISFLEDALTVDNTKPHSTETN